MGTAYMHELPEALLENVSLKPTVKPTMLIEH